MRFSIIIPAYNEDKYIGRCLESVWSALEANHFPNLQPEVIVADNQSDDATVKLSRSLGASVVSEPIRQISRVRNAGARAAVGEWLLFIDADSILNPGSLEAILRCIYSQNSDGSSHPQQNPSNSRYVGGGSVVALDDAPWYGTCLVVVWNLISRCFRWAAGSFIFCRADAFHDVGGFSTELFAAEEIDLTKKLKRWGKRRGLRFMILTDPPHVSSGRKFRLYSLREIFGQFFRLVLLNRFALRHRKHLRFFYEGRR